MVENEIKDGGTSVKTTLVRYQLISTVLLTDLYFVKLLSLKPQEVSNFTLSRKHTGLGFSLISRKKKTDMYDYPVNVFYTNFYNVGGHLV